MAKPLIDTGALECRTIVADRRLRLLGVEAVNANGRVCDACDDDAQRFCAVGALIRAALPEHRRSRASASAPVGEWQA